MLLFQRQERDAVQSVGYEAGRPEGEEVVHIYVTKGSRKAVKSLEREIDGVRILVDNIGNLVVRLEAATGNSIVGNVYERAGRIACGSSCAPSGERYAGTLGAIVRNNNGQHFCLSNNHVFAACNHTPVGMPILSPSSIDGRPGGRAPGEVCRHSQIVELRSGEPSLVPTATEDIALASLIDNRVMSSWQGDTVDGYDTPINFINPIAGLQVKKFGRTTGLTYGEVESLIPSPTPIPYKAKYFNARVWFTDIWTIRARDQHFALPGDSGSLIVTEDASQAVGILFAASPRGDYGYIIPIERVLNHFGGISLVNNYGCEN